MGSSTLFGEEMLNRILTFSSQPGADGKNPGTNYLFNPNFMLGTYTDRLAPVNATLEYLARESSGVFILMEDLPVMPFPNPPTTAPRAFARSSREVTR
jgi:hypothetical protein